MTRLGMQLTVSARGAYPVQDQPGNIQLLIAFNEMQHQIYGRIRHLERGEAWTIESFVNGLIEKSAHYKVQSDLNWAFNHSF